MSDAELVQRLLESVGIKPSHVLSDDVARLEVHQNHVVGAHLVPGLEVDTTERDDGIEAHLRLTPGARIERPIHLCFGMLPEKGLQRIVLEIDVEEDASAQVLASGCTKLLVRYSASLCSLYWLRGRDWRMAWVSGCQWGLWVLLVVFILRVWCGWCIWQTRGGVCQILLFGCCLAAA